MSVTISAKNISPAEVWDACHEMIKVASSNVTLKNPDTVAVNPLSYLLLQSGPEGIGNYLRASHSLEAHNKYSPAWSGLKIDDGMLSGIVTVSPDQSVSIGKNRGLLATIVDVVSLDDDSESVKTLLDDGLDIAELYFPGQLPLTILGVSRQREKQLKSPENSVFQKKSQPLEKGIVDSKFSELVFVGGIKRRLSDRSMRIRRRAAVFSNRSVSV